MLPVNEHACARQLLRMLADDELFPLANTIIASRRIVIRSRSGEFLDDSFCWYLYEDSWLQIIYVTPEIYGAT